MPARWQCHGARRNVGATKEISTLHRSNGVSVYYPFALVALVDYLEADGHKETGEVHISLRDEDGVQVTVRLTAEAVRQLRERLALPPDPTPGSA